MVSVGKRHLSLSAVLAGILLLCYTEPCVGWTPGSGLVRSAARRRSIISASISTEPRTAVDRSITGPNDGESSSQLPAEGQEWRRLGSFERLLTRKYLQGERLSIPHVCAAVVDGPLDVPALEAAMAMAVRRHPLLRARIDGDGLVVNPPAAGVRVGAEEPRPFVWRPCELSDQEVVKAVVQVVDAPGGDVSSSWQQELESALDATDVDLRQGPLWRLRAIRGPSSFALVFSFNHAISDQVSTNTLIHEVLRDMQHDDRPSSSSPVEPLLFPPSLEEAVLGSGEPSFGLPSLIYLLRQGLFGLLGPTILPHTYDRARPIPSGQRRTICEFRTLGRGELEALRRRCKQEGVTVTAALAAAMLLSATDFAHAPHDRSDYVYKFLLSLNMRAFSADSPGQQSSSDDWAKGAVACAAGAMDFTTRLRANSGRSLMGDNGSPSFWSLARQCRGEFLDFVERGFVAESVRLFDWGMRSVEINDVVEKEADNPATAGRAYTCGVSNMGVFGGQGVYGPRRLQAVHYATSHSLTGSLYQLSCGTVGGQLCMTMHFCEPIVGRDTAAAFADSYVKLLRAAGGDGDDGATASS